MFRNYLWIAFLTLFAPLKAQFTSADQVIATVGNEIILLSDVESQYMLMAEKMRSDMPSNARAAILDKLLSNALILAQAERDSVLASEDEVGQQLDSRIDEILAYMGNSQEQFYTYYSMTPAEMKLKMQDDMRKQLIVQKMQGKMTDNVTVTPREVSEFLARIPKDSLPYFGSEVELGEIIVKPKVSAAEDEKARKTAETVRTMLLEDTSRFAEIAYEYSNDRGSAEQGGMIGFTPRGNLVPEYEAAAYALSKGEISEVVKSEYGYHVIQLLARLGNNINTRHVLIRPLINLEDEELAAKYLDSIRNLIIRDTFTFDQAIQRFSEDKTSRTRNGDITNPNTGQPFFETGDLEPNVFFAIEKLKVGEMTPVLEAASPTGERYFRIIRLRNRTLPHVANLKDDYYRIYSAALEEKKNKSMDTWVNKYIPRHSVELFLDPSLKAKMGDISILERWTKPKP